MRHLPLGITSHYLAAACIAMSFDAIISTEIRKNSCFSQFFIPNSQIQIRIQNDQLMALSNKSDTVCLEYDFQNGILFTKPAVIKSFFYPIKS